MRRPVIVAMVCWLLSCCLAKDGRVKVGADLLFGKYFSLIEGKRIGLVTNQTAILSNGKHLADAIFEDKRTNLVALFGPEHGIRGDAPAGAGIENDRDPKTGVTVYSLYGSVTKPSAEMLVNVDVLIYDIQDVGARFYTFESTLSLAMEAAAEHGIAFLVLDRPNPSGGNRVEGFIRIDSLRSFVGMNPTPITHGLTIGELATMINGEGWLKNGLKANLKVIPMEGWKRDQWYDQTGLAWISPSPNLPTFESTVVYPGMCLFEGTNLSEGRGTDHPFEVIGAPYVDGKRWAKELNHDRLPGVMFAETAFIPHDIPNMAMNPKYKGEVCAGIRVIVTDRDIVEPVKMAVYLLSTVRTLYPEKFKWREGGMDRLSGTPILRKSIDAGLSPEKIAAQWKKDVDQFKKLRTKYLLY